MGFPQFPMDFPQKNHSASCIKAISPWSPLGLRADLGRALALAVAAVAATAELSGSSPGSCSLAEASVSHVFWRNNLGEKPP